MQRAIDANDEGALRAAAYGLKSSSANVGAMKLHGLCKELESLARRRQLADAAERIALIEREFGATRVILRQELPGDSE